MFIPVIVGYFISNKLNRRIFLVLREDHVEKSVKANRIVQEKKHKHPSKEDLVKHHTKGSHKSKRHTNWTKAYEDGDLEEYNNWEA
jgi:hypothetical protein